MRSLEMAIFMVGLAFHSGGFAYNPVAGELLADYVYEVWPLKTLHPAGYEVVDAVKGR